MKELVMHTRNMQIMPITIFNDPNESISMSLSGDVRHVCHFINLF